MVLKAMVLRSVSGWAISLTLTGPTRLRLLCGQLTDPELMKNSIICCPDGGQVVGRGTGFPMGGLSLLLCGPPSQQERGKPGTEDIPIWVTVTADLSATVSHQAKSRVSVGSD